MSDSIENLRVFDGEDGLYRLGGSRELYRELLADFVGRYAGAAAEYRVLIKGKDKEPARRLVHTVKGVSGNLGCPGLHKAAADLEGAVKAGDIPRAGELLPFFEKNLDEAVKDIRNSGVLNIQESPPKERGNEKMLSEALIEFVGYAGGRKAKSAAEVLESINRYKWPEDTTDLIKEMTSLSKGYKLKDAALAAERILEKIGGSADAVHK